MRDDILRELHLIDWAADVVGEMCDAPRYPSPGAPAEAAAQAARLVRTLQSLTPEYRAWLNARYRVLASFPRRDRDGVEIDGTDEPDVLGSLEKIASPANETPRPKGGYERAVLVRAVVNLLRLRPDIDPSESWSGDLVEIIMAVTQAGGFKFDAHVVARDAIKKLGEITRERGDLTR